MGVFVLDNFVDTPGTSATAHTPIIGGAISAQSTAAAVITTANRMRGTAQGTLVYANLPAATNYAIEATVYVASNANGFGISLSGVLLSYAANNGYWTLSGATPAGPAHVDQVLGVGSRYKLKIAAQTGGAVTVLVDGVQIFAATADSALPVGPAGFFFLAADTNTTGYQLESFTAYDGTTGTVDLDGTFLIEGGTQLLIGSDNEFYLLGLIDRITGNYNRAAGVSAQVATLDGTTIGSAVTMAFVSGSLTVHLPNGQTRTASDGNYRGQLPAATSLVLGASYLVTATATVGGNVRTFRGAYTAGHSTT